MQASPKTCICNKSVLLKNEPPFGLACGVVFISPDLHMKFWGKMLSYICSETTISLQNQSYLKANINKFGNKLLLTTWHVLQYFPVWHHNMLISRHLKTSISYCLTIWLAHPRLIPVLSLQGSPNLLREVPNTVKFCLQESFSFAIKSVLARSLRGFLNFLIVLLWFVLFNAIISRTYNHSGIVAFLTVSVQARSTQQLSAAVKWFSFSRLKSIGWGFLRSQSKWVIRVDD